MSCSAPQHVGPYSFRSPRHVVLPVRRRHFVDGLPGCAAIDLGGLPDSHAAEVIGEIAMAHDNLSVADSPSGMCPAEGSRGIGRALLGENPGRFLEQLDAGPG